MSRRIWFPRRGALGVAVGIATLASTLMVATTAGAQPASPQHTPATINQSCPPPQQNEQAPLPPPGQQGVEDQQNRPCPPPGQQGQFGVQGQPGTPPQQGQQQGPPPQQGQIGPSCGQIQQGQPDQPGPFGPQTRQGPQGQQGRPCPPPPQGQLGQQIVTIAGVAVDSTAYDPGDQVTVTFVDGSGTTVTGAAVSCGEIRLEVSTVSGWQSAGTVVACTGTNSLGTRVITLPPNLPLGTYRLVVLVRSAGNAQQTIYSSSFTVQ